VDVQRLREELEKLGLSSAQVQAAIAASSVPAPQHATSYINIATIRKSAEKFMQNRDRDLFSKWYFGSDGVERLIKTIAECRKATAQSRTFVGLVQATMVGKTRLILEASKRTPIIMIRLDHTNVAYARLLSLVEQEQNKVTRATSFDDWRTCNRRIMLLVRIFFFAYMKYAFLYKEYVAEHCGVDHLFSSNEQELLAICDEISLFNASLLNGGQNYVEQLFREEAAARMDVNDASTTIKKDHQEIASALNGPTFAVDECHVPFNCATGQLFHSDYEKHTPEDVLRWHQHERFELRNRSPPVGYGYATPTTLFSAFRWVLETYLTQPDTHQTTIFASTYFSVWEPLLDESTYSRDKPAIERIYLSGQLSLPDLVQVLKDKHPAAEVESKVVKGILKNWQGRPGFFFDHFLRCFYSTPSDFPLLKRVEEADTQARESLYALFDPALERLKKLRFTGDTTGVPVTGEEVSLFLYFSARIRGGNIYCASNELAQLVSAGFVYVHAYQPGTNGKSIGVINEPLVMAFLLQRAQEPNAHECCDKYIARLIDMASGTGYGNAAEYALANKILTFNKRLLTELLSEWGLTLPKRFSEMVVRAAVATSINDIPQSDPIDFITQLKEDRLVLPRDGIVMPDVCFFASSPKGKATDLCLVTVQCKTVKEKLDGKEFDGAIRSTSIDKMFKEDKAFRNKWSTFMASPKGKRVRFVRVIVCTAGWTGSQQSAVAQHNEQHRGQPILLADASARTALFGSRCAAAIKQCVGEAHGFRASTGEAKSKWVLDNWWASG